MRASLLRLLFGLAVLLLLLVVADWYMGGVTQRLLAGTATLAVESVPPGAAVFVDAEPLGETPLTVSVTPGRRVLKISHRLHADYVEPLEVARDARVVKRVELAAAQGRLRIVSNPKGASIELDGKTLAGETPFTVTAPTGEHVVGLALPGRARVEQRVEVMPDAVVDVRVELNRARMGELMVDVTPAIATVEFLDSAERYRRGMEVPVGYYRLEVSHAGYVTQVVEATVGLGENRVNVVLERER